MPGAGPVRREHLPLPSRSAKLDLTVAAHEVDEGPVGLEGQAELDRELFDPTTVRRLLRAFGHLLEAAAEDPDRRLSELPLVAGAERHQLLHEWNDTRSDYPAEAIGALLARAALATPDAVAATFAGDASPGRGTARPRALTYAELGRRGARLAARLAARGAGPDVPVGLAVERSVEMLVGLAGIVATGAAYLPLDPDYPEERLRLMLEDTGAPIVVTAGAVSPGLEAILSETGVARVDLLEPSEATDGDAPPRLSPARRAHPENVACILFTSGSTGRPKGVSVLHRGIARMVFDVGYGDLGSHRRVGLGSTLAFDAATFEIWGTLLRGATLVGLDREVVLDLERLAGELARRRVSHQFLTTALFHQLVRIAEEGHRPAREVLAGLDELSFGGEGCDPERVRQAS
jgi:aspartate racemase